MQEIKAKTIDNALDAIHRPVFFTSAGLIIAFSIYGGVFSNQAGSTFAAVQRLAGFISRQSRYFSCLLSTSRLAAMPTSSLGLTIRCPTIPMRVGLPCCSVPVLVLAYYSLVSGNPLLTSRSRQWVKAAQSVLPEKPCYTPISIEECRPGQPM